MTDAPAAIDVTPLGPAFDLLGATDERGFLLERGGLGVAAAGDGAILEVRGAGDAIRDAGRLALRSLRSFRRDRGAAAPVAVGALPFGPGPATLHIPRHAVRRTEPGRTWLLESDGSSSGGTPPGSASSRRRSAVIPHEAFTELQLTPRPTPVAFTDAVRTAVERIAAGPLRKVVLARQLEVDAGRPLDAALLAARLRSVDPEAYTFVARTPRGTLVGASPELLLSRRGRRIGSNPLAGSAPRSGDPHEDRSSARDLHDSAKDREEHAIVVEAVAQTLGPFCEQLAWDPEPVLLATANVWHLSTRFAGTLRDPAPDALELVAALHPTPAVCGSPRDEARAAIGELEPFERGSYAGPVGWIDADGDGDWAIALRCAEIDGEHATLYAGAGIVAASEPVAELEETERKFRAFLDSLRWG
jgi:isochorismate synthase